jgi:hypothetical protein
MKWLLLALCILSSCSGYRFKNQRNPLVDEGIKSISVPMFINKSSIPNASHIFTKDVVDVLADSTDIRIYMGDNRKADALLIGIIDSPKRYQDLYEKGGTFFIDKDENNEQTSSIGDRSSFFIPRYRKYSLTVRLVLIRHPSDVDKKLINSELLPYLQRSKKIVFNRILEREVSAELSIRGTDLVDSTGITNTSRSRYYFEASLRNTSISVANDFRDLVLNVF